MPKTRLNTRTLPLAAIALSVVGLGCTTFAGDIVNDLAGDGRPVACALDIDRSGQMLTFSGSATAREDVSGTYDLTIARNGRGGSATIRQSGPFSLKAGETATLGQAMLNGSRDEFDAQMTLRIGGERLTCSGLGPIDI